jgi:hypothetical protein
MTSGSTVTFVAFQNKALTLERLTQHLINDDTVSRSLSDKRNYHPAMKRLLLDGPINRYHDKDEALFLGAYRFGIVEFTGRYDFPSPLHRQVWSWILLPKNQYNYHGDLFALIKDTVTGLQPDQLSRSDRCTETNKQNPPEAQYSHEWYRSLHTKTGGNVVISPEYATVPGKRRGRIDFYIPSMKWGIEIVQDRSKLREHSDHFLTDAHRALVMSGSIIDYAQLDFRHNTLPTPTPG